MESQHNSATPLLDFVEQTRLAAPAKSSTAYALDSFLPVARANAALTPAALITLWTATALIDGKKLSTVSRYLAALDKTIGAAAGNERQNSPDILPSTFSIEALNEARSNAALIPAIIARHSSPRATDSERATAAAFLLLLYNPRLSIADIAALTFDTADADPVCPQTDDIIAARSRANGRRYVLPLGQGKARPAQIARTLTADIHTLLANVGMRFAGGFSRNAITAIWAAEALRAGIALPRIAAIVGTPLPAALAPLALLAGAPDLADKPADAEIRNTLAAVADTICSYTRTWFAMKLRRGTAATDVSAALATHPALAAAVTLYYPMRTTVHRDGHRRTAVEEPILPDILFFNTRPDRVRPLFAAIGNIAWCFRTSPTGPYATIPAAQMQAFQRIAGIFTDDIKAMLPCPPSRQLTAGRRVRITGGIMAGYEGTIVDIDQTRRLLTLSIGNATIAAWTTTVEDIYIDPLE